MVQRPSQEAKSGEWARSYYKSPFYLFGVLQSPRALVLRRTATRYPNLAAVQRETAQVIAHFPDQKLRRLLVDMRLAPPTNDPAFEQAMATLRAECAARVETVVVLVATASGSMQCTRLNRDDGTSFQITRDPQEAHRLAAS